MKYINILEKAFSWIIAMIVVYILTYVGILLDPSLATSNVTGIIYAVVTGVILIPTYYVYLATEKIKEHSTPRHTNVLRQSALSAWFSPFNKRTRLQFEERGVSTILALGRPGKGAELYQWRFVESHKEAAEFQSESPHSWEMVTIFDNQDVLPIKGLVASSKSV